MSGNLWLHVYVIGRMIDDFPHGPIKIGISADATKRLRGLQTASPYELVLVSMFLVPNREFARLVETAAHDAMGENHMKGEWFDIEPWPAILTLCEIFECVADEADNEDQAARILDVSFTNENARRVTKVCKYLQKQIKQ